LTSTDAADRTPNHSLRRGAAVLAAVAAAGVCLGAAAPSGPKCGWRAGEVLEVDGVASRGGLTGPFRRWIELGSGRSRETMDLGAISTAQGYDGRLAWSQDVSGASHDLDSGFARALARSEAWLSGGQGCLNGQARVRDRGVQAQGERRLAVREVSPPGGATFELWTDTASGRSDRAILQYAENRLIRRFADWRDLGGGRFVAFREDDEDPEDQETTTYRVSAARVLRRPPDEGFGAPPQPSDVTMLHGRTSTVIPYQDDDRTRVYLPVYLDGEGPFLFELDNGGHFILAKETAAQVGLEGRGAFASSGAGTVVQSSSFATLKELRVGDAVIRNQPARVRGLAAAANERGPQPPRAGILGIELFERFTVAIDRHARTVTLTPRGAPYRRPKGRPLPIVFAEDAPLTPGAFEGVAGDFMLDIGNAGPTIIEEPWAEPRGLARRFETAPRLGDIALGRGRIAIGPFSLPNEVVSYYGRVPLGSESTHAVAGVLGEPLLSRFDATYDLARKTLWLSPAPGVGLKPFNRAGLFLARGPDGTFKASAVWADSPAAAAGLTPGVLVTAIEGRTASSLSRADAAKLLEQPAGTAVRLTVRDAAGPAHEVRLTLRNVL
jgi:hypothetical protein